MRLDTAIHLRSREVDTRAVILPVYQQAKLDVLLLCKPDVMIVTRFKGMQCSFEPVLNVPDGAAHLRGQIRKSAMFRDICCAVGLCDPPPFLCQFLLKTPGHGPKERHFQTLMRSAGLTTVSLGLDAAGH